MVPLHMNSSVRVLGVAPTSTACGVVVVEGLEVVYFWAKVYDRRRSPILTLTAIRKKLVTAMQFLRPTRVACLQYTASGGPDAVLPRCLSAEVRWLSRKRGTKFRSIRRRPAEHRAQRDGRGMKGESEAASAAITQNKPERGVRKPAAEGRAGQALALAYEVAVRASNRSRRSRSDTT